MASGAFVAITANTSGYNNVKTTGMHGISFGYNQTVYLSAASHYAIYQDYDGVNISNAYFTVEPGQNSSKTADLPMYISYPNLKRLNINGSNGYSGDLKVVSGVNVSGNNPPTAQTHTYKFYCGLLVSA